jgi:hypothetical protein
VAAARYAHPGFAQERILCKAAHPELVAAIDLASAEPFYYPVTPLAVPRGTRIEAVAHYDNSAKNPRNPDPTKEVRFGEQTWDEMMNAFIDFTVDGQKASVDRAATTSKQR